MRERALWVPLTHRKAIGGCIHPPLSSWVWGVLILLVLIGGPQPAAGQDGPPIAAIGALAIIPTDAAPIGAAQFTPDGSGVVVWGQGADALSLYAVADGSRQAHYGLVAPVAGIAWGPRDRLVGWSGVDWWIYDGYGAALYLHNSATTPIAGARLAQSQPWLFTWHTDGHLMVWDTEEGDVLHQTIWRYGIDRVAIDSTETRLFLGSWWGAAAIYDLTAQGFVSHFDHATRALVAGIFGASGALTWGWDGSLRWHTAITTTVLDLHTPIWEAAAADTSVLVRAASGNVVVVDASARQVVTVLAHDGAVTSMARRDDTLFTTSDDGFGRLWAWADGIEAVRVGLTGPALGGAWSADGRRVLAWDAAGVVWVFPVLAADDCFITAPNNVNTRDTPNTSGAFLGTLPAHTGRFASAATTGADGFQWYQLDNGAWVRGDVVTAVGMCA